MRHFLSLPDLVPFLLSLDTKDPGSVYTFIYNVQSGIECVHDPDLDDGPDDKLEVTPIMNLSAVTNGYSVGSRLYQLSRVRIQVPLQDLGITIVMLLFARYYAMNQYPILVNTLKTVKEIEHLERFLVSYGKSSVKLPQNLATDAVYGIARNADRFQGTNYLRLTEFNAILGVMKIPDIDPMEFITLISSLHLHIVESFYMFTSITKECRVIVECRDLSDKRLNYTFQKPIKSYSYNGAYWFQVPQKSVWFAHLQGKWTYQAYLGRDADKLMDQLKDTPGLVIGFVHAGTLYPIQMEHPSYSGRWDLITRHIDDRGLNNVFNRGSPMPNAKNVYYVRNGIPSLYKLYTNKKQSSA